MPSTAAASLSVLIADDHAGIRSLLVQWLSHLGHVVASVASAQEATRLLTERAFDLVITDVVMPDGDGFELIAALRKAQPSARVVAISGGGKYLEGTDCLRIARGLGAHAVVMKPFNWDQLQAGMEAALLTRESDPA
jgi:CheY-like chemotaxis protein